MILVSLHLETEPTVGDRVKLCFVSPNGRRYFARPERRGSQTYTTGVEPGSILEAQSSAGKVRVAVLENAAVVQIPNKPWKMVKPLYLAGWRPTELVAAAEPALRLTKGNQTQDVTLGSVVPHELVNRLYVKRLEIERGESLRPCA